MPLISGQPVTVTANYAWLQSGQTNVSASARYASGYWLNRDCAVIYADYLCSLSILSLADYVDAPFHSRSAAAAYFITVDTSVRPERSAQGAPNYIVPDLLSVDFAGEQPFAGLSAQHVNFDFDPQPAGVTCYALSNGASAGWRQPSELTEISRLPWGTGERITNRLYVPPTPEPDEPDPDPAPEPLNKDTYTLMNSISVISRPGSTPLHTSNMSISIDIDSFAWSLTATINGSQSAQYLEPTMDGPAEVEVTVNGWTWVFMITTYTETTVNGKVAFSVTGTSRTSYLASPYAPLRSKMVTADTLAQQIAIDELSGTGFTVSWSAVDWTVAANSYSYTGKAPMEVLAELADSAGAIICPALAADSIDIRPRYLTPPWDYASASPDHIILTRQVSQMSVEHAPGQLYNAAFIAGTNDAMIAVAATRDGSVGDQPCPDLFHALYQDVQQARAKATAIMADSGDQKTVSLKTNLWPPGEAPELAIPGALIEVRDAQAPENDWRGLVIGVRIDCGGLASVYQHISIERSLEH